MTKFLKEDKGKSLISPGSFENKNFMLSLISFLSLKLVFNLLLKVHYRPIEGSSFHNPLNCILSRTSLEKS